MARVILALLIGTVLESIPAAPAHATSASVTPTLTPVSVAPDLTPTFNGTVRSIVYSSATVYVAGDFTVVHWAAVRYPRERIAAFNVTTGVLLPFNPGADAPVHGLAISGSTLFAVGEFAIAGGLARRHLVAFDAVTGAVRPTFAQPVNGVPLTVAAGADRLYIGGTVSSVGGVARSNVAAFSLSTGFLDPVWHPDPERRVESIVVSGARVYLGGIFSDVDGVARTQKIAAVNAVTGAVDQTFQSSVYQVVHALTVAPGGALYAAAGGLGGRGYSVRADGAVNWVFTADGDAQAVSVYRDTVYWGGHFDRACLSDRTGDHGVCLDGSVPRVKLAATTLSGVITPWAPTANGVHGVLTSAVSTALGKVAFGGAFTKIDGLYQRRFAQVS